MTDLFDPDRFRTRQEHYFHYLKGRIDKAFDWGTVVAIRTQVWPEDKEDRFATHSIQCPLCYDEVRQEAKDPQCPQCRGNGWVEENKDTGEITQGYRPLVIVKAHVEELSDEQRRNKDGGYSHVQKDAFWVQYLDVRLRDGDLLAEIIPDNYTNPKRVRKVLQKWEVVSNITPDFKPVGAVDDNLVAQRVNVVTLDRERPEWDVDMGESQLGGTVERTGSKTNITEFEL